MPKKKNLAGGQKKAKAKNTTNKPAVDKTFGLKNKKGKKAAVMIKNFQVSNKQISEEKERKKESERAKQRELARKQKELKEQQEAKERAEKARIELEEKAKILCKLFVTGDCRMGDACEYLHDWSKVKRTEKIDPYTDPRKGTDNFPGENAMLCYNFLEAVKSKKYGFFWVCPNKGAKCKYKHYLPRGYILSDDLVTPKAGDDFEEDTDPIENIIDLMRNKLIEENSEGTTMTIDILFKWQKENLPGHENTEKDNLTEQSKKISKQTKQNAPKRMTGKEYFLQKTLNGEEEEESYGCEGDLDEFEDLDFDF